MPRTPGLWWWKQADQWAVTIRRQRHRLGKDEEAAKLKYHELMSKPDDRVQSDSVKAIADLFLAWTEKHNAPATFDWYQKHLQNFLDSLSPPHLPVDRLKAHHVDAWVDAHDWGPSYRRGAMTAVARCLNWADKKGHIERNPIRRKLDKPAPGKREVVLSAAQFKKLLKHVPAGEFHDLLAVAWDTGCRPQEITRVEARHVDVKKSRWVFPAHEAKGRKKQRTVYLSPAALTITKRLMMKHPSGFLFRNGGEQWTRFAIADRFGKLKSKVGQRYRLYDFRHSFITNGLKRGVDPITMASLVGHVSLKMIHEIYSHLSLDSGHMRKAALRAISRA